MHVTPTELRVVRRGDLLLRFALLDQMAYVLAETPVAGSAGTSLEEPCVDPHWGVVLRGALELRRDGSEQRLPAGTAFHVPAGQPAHRFAAEERTVFAGFVPIGESVFGAPLAYGTPPDADDAEPARDIAEPVVVRLMAGAAGVPVRSGSIEAEAAAMGELVVTRVVFGPTSGYGTAWCDLPHWGMVLTGGMGIEWEHDVEVLTAGDVFYCPAGPPGHRLEVADSAVVVDFTPREALRSARRIVDWRPRVDELEAARPG